MLIPALRREINKKMISVLVGYRDSRRDVRLSRRTASGGAHITPAKKILLYYPGKEDPPVGRTILSDRPGESDRIVRPTLSRGSRTGLSDLLYPGGVGQDCPTYFIPGESDRIVRPTLSRGSRTGLSDLLYPGGVGQDCPTYCLVGGIPGKPEASGSGSLGECTRGHFGFPMTTEPTSAQYWSAPTASPPLRVPMAQMTVMFVLLLRNLTEPSANRALAPPEW